MITNGIDLVEIKRIIKSIENPHFLERVYSSEELKNFESNNANPENYAGSFSAKEAFSKALGTGIRGFKLSEVEILHDDFGCPYFRLSGEAKRIAQEKNLKFALSITHTAEYAAAMVTAYTEV